MDAQSCQCLTGAVKYISTASGIIGVAWAIAWMLVKG